MLVVYEKFKNNMNNDDERNIGDFETLKEIKMFLETKFDTKTSISNISKIMKNKGTINKKYKIYKINI